MDKKPLPVQQVKNWLSLISDYIFKFLHKYGWIVVCVLATVLSTIAKHSAFFNLSYDYNEFLHGWISFYRENGIKNGLAQALDNYTPFYNYFMALTGQWVQPEHYVYAIKWFNFPFELSFSVAFFFIVYHKFKNLNYSSIAFACSLIIPSIIINGPIWGQYDIIFVSFLFWCIYFLLRKKTNWAMIMFAIAFSIKIQTIFFAPFIIVLVLKREIKIWQLLYIPAIYILFALPTLFCGRPVKEVLLIYVDQTAEASILSWSAPNIYSFIDNNATVLLDKMAIYISLIVTGVVAFYLYQKDMELNIENIILMALISSLFTPFFMPHMHERYFIIADLLSILYIFIKKKGFTVCLLINSASILCCIWNVLRGYGEPNLIPHFTFYKVGALFNLIAVVLLIIEVIKVPSQKKLALEVTDEPVIDSQDQ